MTSSFKKINYALRPGKHASRRMLCEVFGRLGSFQPVPEYVYVGFGSVWFEDFILFHRILGVREMISIERDVAARRRIEENKPFSNITVHYNTASRILPRLDWSRRHFVWLDYEDALSTEILLDVRTVAARGQSGTLIAISVPCKRAHQIEDAGADPTGPSALDRFRDVFGRERVHSAVSEAQLEGWPFGKLSRRMLKAEIQAALAVRNAAAARGDILSFKPICDIEYDDGTKMTTVVGIIAAAGEKGAFAECRFGHLDFLPSKGRLVRVKVPKLTVREVRKLERQLPKLVGGKLDLGSIPALEAKAFKILYRYLPNFAVLES